MVHISQQSRQPKPNKQCNDAASQSTSKAHHSESKTNENEPTPDSSSLMTQPESDKQHKMPPCNQGLLPKSQQHVTV
jgi:hypothetical protein